MALCVRVCLFSSYSSSSSIPPTPPSALYLLFLLPSSFFTLDQRPPLVPTFTAPTFPLSPGRAGDGDGAGQDGAGLGCWLLPPTGGEHGKQKRKPRKAMGEGKISPITGDRGKMQRPSVTPTMGTWMPSQFLTKTWPTPAPRPPSLHFMVEHSEIQD